MSKDFAIFKSGFAPFFMKTSKNCQGKMRYENRIIWFWQSGSEKEPTNLGGRASQVAKREIFLALIEHGPHHFFHKQLLNTHIAFEQLLNAHILLLNCSTCTMAIMLAQPIEKNTLLNGFSAFNVSLHCSVLKPLWAIQTLWGLFCNGVSKKSMHH